MHVMHDCSDHDINRSRLQHQHFHNTYFAYQIDTQSHVVCVLCLYYVYSKKRKQAVQMIED